MAGCIWIWNAAWNLTQFHIRYKIFCCFVLRAFLSAIAICTNPVLKKSFLIVDTCKIISAIETGSYQGIFSPLCAFGFLTVLYIMFATHFIFTVDFNITFYSTLHIQIHLQKRIEPILPAIYLHNITLTISCKINPGV